MAAFESFSAKEFGFSIGEISCFSEIKFVLSESVSCFLQEVKLYKKTKIKI